MRVSSMRAKCSAHLILLDLNNDNGILSKSKIPTAPCRYLSQSCYISAPNRDKLRNEKDYSVVPKGMIFLRNVCTYLQNYTASHHKTVILIHEKIYFFFVLCQAVPNAIPAFMTVHLFFLRPLRKILA